MHKKIIEEAEKLQEKNKKRMSKISFFANILTGSFSVFFLFLFLSSPVKNKNEIYAFIIFIIFFVFFHFFKYYKKVNFEKQKNKFKEYNQNKKIPN